jgi:hypothetical protein
MRRHRRRRARLAEPLRRSALLHSLRVRLPPLRRAARSSHKDKDVDQCFSLSASSAQKTGFARGQIGDVVGDEIRQEFRRVGPGTFDNAIQQTDDCRQCVFCSNYVCKPPRLVVSARLAASMGAATILPWLQPKPESERHASRSGFVIALARKRPVQNNPYATKKRPKTSDLVGNNFVAHITWLLAF